MSATPTGMAGYGRAGRVRTASPVRPVPAADRTARAGRTARAYRNPRAGRTAN
jgi:hypothetical protein